jgi:UDP-GlcNAc:undecaprenyl-phosphate GlcNAc-1-phosphate transferase
VRHAILALFIALVAVAAATPVVRLVAVRLGAVAEPGGRHIHRTVIPRLGGLAIAFGFFVAMTGVWFLAPSLRDDLQGPGLRTLGVVAGALAMTAVGAIDDTKGIRALYKLGLQVVVAVFAFGCGLRIDGVHLPIFGDIALYWMALPVTILWIVGIINAVNLIDGLDGLAAGVVFFAATTNLVVAWLGGSVPGAVVSAAIAGSVLGFLFYNFNPARIFMGDSGSYFLGFVIATSSLGAKASTAVSLLVPVLALGVPIFDTLFAMVRRVLERRSVFSPDRGHIHHRLLDMGLTHRRAVVIIYAVCAVFTLSAIGVSLGRAWQVGAALFGATAALVGLVRFVGYFEYLHHRIRQKSRIRSRDTEVLRHAVPRLPGRFAELSTEAELVDELFEFAKESELGYVEILDTQHGGERAVERWSTSERSARDLVSASYPLGRDGVALSTIRFGWRSDFGDVSPQSEILLQLVADLLTEHLARLHSPLVPAPANAKGDRESAPAIAVALRPRHSRY